MEADEIYVNYQQKRKERFQKDWTFKKLFYQKIDEMLTCKNLSDLQPGIEALIFVSEKIDRKTVYQPMRGFFIEDLQRFLYGLLNWQRIRQLIVEKQPIKQVEVISLLDLEIDEAEFFIYQLIKMGVLKKEKQGRCYWLTYVSEKLSEESLRESWWLFDESKRLPIE